MADELKDILDKLTEEEQERVQKLLGAVAMQAELISEMAKDHLEISWIKDDAGRIHLGKSDRHHALRQSGHLLAFTVCSHNSPEPPFVFLCFLVCP